MPKRSIPELSTKVADQLKMIGLKLTKERQAVEPNYKKFAENHDVNNMTLWRMQNGEDCKLSSLLEVLNAIGITPDDFFKGIR